MKRIGKIIGMCLAILGLAQVEIQAGAPVEDGVDGTAAIPATMRDSISAALDYQIMHYPASQYRDVYKNFMQDFFGPGHILADTAAAGRYLRRELRETVDFDGPAYEKTGFRGNFYRVNLSLIRDGVIPYDAFFDAFVNSVQGIVPPSGDDWMIIWKEIDGVIAEKGLDFQDEATDRESLSRQFSEGDYVVHHSQRYNDAVNFHYRIISREKFDTHLRPLLRKSKQWSRRIKGNVNMDI